MRVLDLHACFFKESSHVLYPSLSFGKWSFFSENSSVLWRFFDRILIDIHLQKCCTVSSRSYTFSMKKRHFFARKKGTFFRNLTKKFARSFLWFRILMGIHIRRNGKPIWQVSKTWKKQGRKCACMTLFLGFLMIFYKIIDFSISILKSSKIISNQKYDYL